MQNWRKIKCFDLVISFSNRCVAVPAADLRLAITPWLADQEMQVSYTYWEGAVRVTGASAGRAVTGNGYVELTGYAGSMQGEF